MMVYVLIEGGCCSRASSSNSGLRCRKQQNEFAELSLHVDGMHIAELLPETQGVMAHRYLGWCGSAAAWRAHFCLSRTLRYTASALIAPFLISYNNTTVL